MANVEGKPSIELSITLKLNEEEARALDALCGYGADEFLRVFYQSMGTAYLQKHEQGLRGLFGVCRSEIPRYLGKVDAARRVFNGNHD